MDRWEIGMLAKSLAGHDKDKVYVIVGLDEQFTYLADGERKTLQSPKKKKKKHVQLIREQHEISEADDVKPVSYTHLWVLEKELLNTG